MLYNESQLILTVMKYLGESVILKCKFSYLIWGKNQFTIKKKHFV